MLLPLQNPWLLKNAGGLIDLARQNQFRSDPTVEPFRFDFDVQRTPRSLTESEEELLDAAWDQYDDITSSSILGVTTALNLTLGMHPVFSKMVRYMTAGAAVSAGIVTTGVKWGMQLTDMDEWLLLNQLEN